MQQCVLVQKVVKLLLGGGLIAGGQIRGGPKVICADYDELIGANDI